MGDAGAPSSSCSPRPALEAASSGPAGAALPAGDCLTVSSSSPSLTGGEFLLHLLKRNPQCGGDAPPLLLSAHGDAGGGNGDPAVAVVGPSIPLCPPPSGGFPPSTTVDAHPYGPPPWTEPCYPWLHQAQWGTAPPAEFGLQRSQPPPTGVQNQRRYTQYHNQNSASKQAGIITAFSPPLGFLGGPLDARDLQWNPGRGQRPPHLHYHQHQQASQRDSSSMDRLPLVFGSFASSSGDLPHCDSVLLKKVDTSFRGGHIRSGVLDRQHIAPNTKRQQVPDSRPSLVGRGFTDSIWTSQLKMQQRYSRPYQSGDSLKKGQDCSSRQRFGKAEPGEPLSPQKKPQDERKRVPVLSNGRSGEDTCQEQAERQRGGPRNLSCHTEPKLSRHLEPAMLVDHCNSSSQREIRVPASDDGECMEHLHSTNISRMQKATPISDDESEAPICSTDSSKRDSQLSEQLFGSFVLSDQISEKTVEVHLNASRGKDYRSDFSRGHHVLSQRMRIRRRELRCPHNLARFAPSLLAIYESLKPSEEEKAKQRQLLQSLEKLVNKEWPNAQLYLYGSCANSFGVSNSDIDVCLVLDENGSNKSDIILKLAEIFQSDNLQNVQALTRARVPIVKLREPVTGISCDICINNTLAVVNTKLLRDYAQIDDRLQQLAFLVKHWAKRRGVNDTYQGTLSSYAYVLMCIHFLQLRKPPILPCLQVMEATYFATVDDIRCAFFDQVEKLRDFGSANKENVAELLWAFFSYWAYHHDYAYDVISVRTGGIISKESKNWTRRVGNDRHLICIEDPFELSHDLGRVVDKYTIKILREEFERAADIMQFDPNPGTKLFELYVRPSESGLIV